MSEAGQKRSTVRLAVSMGDPAGVGAEVILGCLPHLPDNVQLTVYGDMGTMKAAAEALSRRGDEGIYWQKELDVVSVSCLAHEERRFGKPTALTGEVSYNFILSAALAVMKGEADALVTAPVSKRWIIEAGHDFSGHTELLARITKTAEYAMMLVGPSLKVALVTTHSPLADVPSLLSVDKIASVIRLTAGHLEKWFGVEEPLIGCAGLNPHAGEGGKLGREELEIIEPAIEAARAEGVNATGPHPADALFAHRGKYDAIVCMYHDQALGPLKALHFDEAVNLTLGLSIVRLSPCHGAAFDIAGTGTASPSSMLNAMLMAAHIVKLRASKPEITN